MKNKNGNQVHLSGEPDLRVGGDLGTRGQGDRLILSPDKWFPAPDNSSGEGEKFGSLH